MGATFATFNSPDELEAIEETVFLAMAIRAAMELDVFSQLADGPRTPEEVATALGVDGWRLGRLMHCLVHGGLVEVTDGRFSNTALASQCLVKGQPGYMGGIHELWSDLWNAMLFTAESVRNGKAADLHDFGNMSEDDLSSFFRGLHAGTTRAGRNLSKKLDLGRFGNFLDAGGGSGGVAVGVCREIEDMRATIADLPKVARIAQGFVDDEGLQGRISVEGVDLANSPPSGSYDVAMLRSLLQTVGPDDASRILDNIGKAIRPGGEIHIIGRILEDNRIDPATNAFFDVVFLNIYDGGAAYTFSEHKSWLEPAGFGQITMQDGPGGHKIVSAVKG